MDEIALYIPGTSAAIRFAGAALQKAGIPVWDHPAPEVTHVLLGAPAFDADGALKDGGSLPELLERLPDSITILGGMLNHPFLEGYRIIDFLKQESYLAKNAAITAQCAITLAAGRLECIWAKLPVLVLGWGRIGKCLGKYLTALGAQVTIAARNQRDLAMAEALGYGTLDLSQVPGSLGAFPVVFNTIPTFLGPVPGGARCLCIDLASRQGLVGPKVIWARGLPGIMAPRSSGELIAAAAIQYIKEEAP